MYFTSLNMCTGNLKGWYDVIEIKFKIGRLRKRGAKGDSRKKKSSSNYNEMAIYLNRRNISRYKLWSNTKPKKW